MLGLKKDRDDGTETDEAFAKLKMGELPAFFAKEYERIGQERKKLQ